LYIKIQGPTDNGFDYFFRLYKVYADQHHLKKMACEAAGLERRGGAGALCADKCKWIIVAQARPHQGPLAMNLLKTGFPT
jgi:hypothetical protein